MDSHIIPTPMSHKYRLQKCIGKGNFGDVYRAAGPGGTVAIKIVDLDESSEDILVLVLEIQFLVRLRLAHITQYVETFLDGTTMWIVMEYCGGGLCGDLLRVHKRLSEEVVAYIMTGVLRGLAYLHAEKKVHRDIKLANILLTDHGVVKLADFGVSGELTLTLARKNTFVGTPYWMAPEVISRQKTGYNEKADIWLVGITVIELATGLPPWAQYDPMKIVFDIPKKKPPTLPETFSENIRDFVRYCLVKSPKHRPGAAGLLHHRFVTLHRARNAQQALAKLLTAVDERSRRPRHVLSPVPPNGAAAEALRGWSDHMAPNGKNGVDGGLQVEMTELQFEMEELHVGPAEMQAEPPVLQVESPRVQETPAKTAILQVGSKNPAGPSLQVTSASPKPTGGRIQWVFDTAPRQHAAPLSGAPAAFMLAYCLQRVHERAKSTTTKDAVLGLARAIAGYEEQQPGLAEALVDELIHFRVS